MMPTCPTDHELPALLITLENIASAVAAWEACTPETKQALVACVELDALSLVALGNLDPHVLAGIESGLLRERIAAARNRAGKRSAARLALGADSLEALGRYAQEVQALQQEESSAWAFRQATARVLMLTRDVVRGIEKEPLYSKLFRKHPKAWEQLLTGPHEFSLLYQAAQQAVAIPLTLPLLPEVQAPVAPLKVPVRVLPLTTSGEVVLRLWLEAADRNRYRLEWEAASLEQALAAIAQRDGGIHCNQTMLLLHALARTLRWRCDIHASALRHLARE